MMRRFPVVTHGVSPDLKRIHPDFGRINRGDISRQVLAQVLDVYRRLDNQWGAFISRFEIEAETGRYVIRSADQQLTMALADQSPAQAVPVTIEQALTRLEEVPVVSVAPPRPPPDPLWLNVATIVLLCSGAALIAHALQRKPAPLELEPVAEVVLVHDAADAQARQQAVAGLFATGRGAGDRHITITPKGHVVFAELGARQSAGLNSDADSFRIGRRDSRTCLVTSRSGVIEAVSPNMLLYFGDTYRRIE
jgi:hypothetical protein